MLKSYHKPFLFLFAILIFFLPLESYAAIPTVTSANGGQAENGQWCQFDIAVAASDTMIVVGINTEAAINSISDEDSNTYTQRVLESTNHYTYIYTAESPATNAANTITIQTAGGSEDTTCFALALAGTETTTPIGNTGSNSGTSGTSDTITYSTANDNSLIVHVCGSEWNIDHTWDTGKTEQNEQLNGGANKFGGAIATEGQATAGSNDGTCDWARDGVNWSHAMIEVKEAPSTATPRSWGFVM